MNILLIVLSVFFSNYDLLNEQEKAEYNYMPIELQCEADQMSIIELKKVLDVRNFDINED